MKSVVIECFKFMKMNIYTNFLRFRLIFAKKKQVFLWKTTV